MKHQVLAKYITETWLPQCPLLGMVIRPTDPAAKYYKDGVNKLMHAFGYNISNLW
jgi:hypothetical protein